MDKIVLNVEGMRCEHCKARVENALAGVDGVSRAEASLEGKKVVVEYDSASVGLQLLKDAVEDCGFEVV